MKKLILIMILFYTIPNVYGQEDIEILKNKNGIIESVRFPSEDEHSGLSGAKVPETVDTFLKEYLKISSSDEFIKVPQKQRRKDYLHEHYNQYFKGIKVDGGGYNFHFKNERLFLADGNYIKIENLEITPKITV